MSPGKERAVITVALMFFVYPLYHPLSHYGAHRAHSPAIFIDHWVPLVSEWMWAYFMVYLAALMPLAVVRMPALFRRMAFAYLVTMIVSFNIFWIFPVRMTLRPDSPVVNSFASWGLRLTYHLDQPLNCFPSLHVGMAVLAALSCWRVDRFWGTVMIGIAMAISASTMLVKQHFLVDVIGGTLVAVVAYRLIVIPYRVEGRAPLELRFPRWVGGLLMLVYWLLVLAIYQFGYRAGWQPWSAA
jgi:membrane-associated phospholipid phosphatase